jgi:D-lactate dehydrogenase
MRYSHFGCNVVHEDLAYEEGVDTHEAKMGLKSVVDHECKGKLPAEHGHGTEYHAPKDTQKRWQKMDPLNVMNPGIGGLSSKFRYRQ